MKEGVELLVGHASVDISTERSLEMGSANGKFGTGTFESLELNIVVLRPELGNELFVFVSLDSLYPGSCLSDALRTEAERYGNAFVVVGASHTHRAPLIDATKIGLGQPDPQYMEFVKSRALKALSCAIESCDVPTRLLSGRTSASHSINRRLRKRLVINKRGFHRGVLANAPNVEGMRDEKIVLVEFRSEAGEVLAIVWNYACHPVAHPQSDMYSAHYPGVVRSHLRRRYRNKKLPVLFFQGFSGDTRPDASATPRKFKNRLRALLTGPTFDDMSAKTYSRWTSSLAQTVLAIETAPINTDPCIYREKRIPSMSFADTCDNKSDLVFQSLLFGSGLLFLAISAEMSSGYGYWLRRSNPELDIVLIACTEDVFGYVPTSDMLAEGGYEVFGSLKHFGMRAIHTNIEESMLTAIAEVGPGELKVPRRISTELNECVQ